MPMQVHVGNRDDLQVPLLLFAHRSRKAGAHEAADFTPYLLQLGLAKTQTSLVFIAPPLSGLIVQPIIGTISDSSTLRWGRRRPYMMVGSLMVAACFLTLGWASEIVGLVITDEARVGVERCHSCGCQLVERLLTWEGRLKPLWRPWRCSASMR